MQAGAAQPGPVARAGRAGAGGRRAQRGIAVGGELSLFASALAELKAQQGYAPGVLAVTGTNGKTTVTALTGQLVERAGKTVAVAGNIGPTLLDTLGEKIDAGALPQVWVIELSSFQLDARRRFRADRRRRAERDAGPPGLARQHGGLRRGQGAGVRQERA